RFDQEPFSAGLASLGLESERVSTQVLELADSYEKTFGGYNATIRNQVRRSRKEGVVVREVAGVSDVLAYYDVHTRLVKQRGGYRSIYPVKLFLNLTKLHDTVRLLVAEWQHKIIAGGVFFHDGCSVMYWHSAADREFSKVFPSCLVVDEAI